MFKKPIPHKLASILRYEIDGLDVTHVEMATDRRSTELTTSPQNGTPYVVEVSMVKGSGNHVRVVNAATAPFAGNPAPRIIDIKPISETSILVTVSDCLHAQHITT